MRATASSAAEAAGETAVAVAARRESSLAVAAPVAAVGSSFEEAERALCLHLEVGKSQTFYC